MRISDWSSDLCSSDLDRLRRYPDAHIYHYAAYEETALKRLAMFHGTREGEVDDFLRDHKLVDLYRVVREAIRTSESAYSIKNMEKFYLGEARAGEVMTAGDSIVMRSEEHTSELQSLMRISYAVFCLKKNTNNSQTSEK